MEFEVILPSDNFQEIAFSGILDALSHFGELVSLEARNEQFLISAFNSARTAQAVVHVARQFFKGYKLLRRGSIQSSIPCTVSNRNFNSILKKNMAGIKNIKECHIRITQTPEARIYMKLIYRNGVTKKNTIWYNEGDAIVHLFQQNHPFKMECEPGVLKMYMNKFDPRIQELALTLDHQKVTLASHWDDSSCLFGDRPVKSTCILQKTDFKEYKINEPVTLVMNLKEFKTIVDYMDSMESTVVIEFTEPGRPLLFRHRYQSTMIVLVALMTQPEHLSNPSSSAEMSYASVRTEPYRPSSLQRRPHPPPTIPPSSPSSSSSSSSNNNPTPRLTEPVTQPSPEQHNDTIPISLATTTTTTHHSQVQQQDDDDDNESLTLSQRQYGTTTTTTPHRLTTIERIRLQKKRQQQASPMSLPSLDHKQSPAACHQEDPLV